MQAQNGTSDRADLEKLIRTAEARGCGFLLDFHCQNLFEHPRIASLTGRQRAELATALRDDLDARPRVSAPMTSGENSAPETFARADAFIEPLPIAHVENGLAGDMAQHLFRTWHRNRGVVFSGSDLVRLCPWLILTLPFAAPGDVPHVTFIGSQSSFVKFFPQAQDVDAFPSPGDCLPLEYRQGVAEGYQLAFEGEPCFDVQRTGHILGEGLPDMTLQRLLLRFETKTGFARVFSLVTLLEMHSRPFDSNRTDHRRWRQHGLSWHPAYQVSARLD